MKPFFVSVPHAGEEIPSETPWLKQLPETVLMCDVDRYVDQLYRPAIEALKIPFVVTRWHRFVVDLNRFPEDVDVDSVEGSTNPVGTFPRGFYWSVTTKGERVLPKPLSQVLHQQLVEKYFRPFHQEVERVYGQFKTQGAAKVFHVDAHSMPSKGTKAHRDPGETRAQIVVSDCSGKSCEPWFRDLVVESYRRAGFGVAVNWPYLGGRVTETYGHPDRGQNAIQVEMSRALYMDEVTKQLRREVMPQVQLQLQQALRFIYTEIPAF
ncbi:MAG: N-formylglutamate amidohydrolase [Bdellovibrionales bacterium]|nr:N-formylglutamate amidohydrolase [Bdellovibrionales bacterium]